MIKEIEIIIAGHVGTGKTHLADLISGMLRDVGLNVNVIDELENPMYNRPFYHKINCHRKLVDMNQKGELPITIKTKQLARDFISVGKSKSIQTK